MSTQHNMPWIIVDLDGTLADTKARIHHLDKKDFNAFHAAGRTAEELPACQAVRAMLDPKRVNVCIMTGRDALYREGTIDWLAEHNIEFSRLYMRAPKDHRPDTVAKAEMFADLTKHVDPKNILFVLEDRTKVVNWWRQVIGLPCFQVQEGDY